MTLGNDGNFYGTTYADGASDFGSVFRMTPTGVVTTVYSFGSDGTYPKGKLTLGTDGNFYGTTFYGGGTTGTVFKITPAGVLTTLYTFSNVSNGINADGAFPASGVIEGSDSNFYGTTSGGGPNGTGTVFKLSYAPSLPSISSALYSTATVGLPYSYQITATNSPTSFNATGKPSGLTVNSSGLISGTPASSANGVKYLTLDATNSVGTGTATLVLSVGQQAAPVITSTTNAVGTVNTFFSYQIMATNNPTSYAATRLPTGLSVNTMTGLISGMLGPNSDGAKPIPLSATNAYGTGTTTLNLSVATQ